VDTDAADAEAVEQLMTQAADVGTLRVLVNNAGGWLPGPQYPERREWPRRVDLNLVMPMLAAQLAVPMMIGGGLVEPDLVADTVPTQLARLRGFRPSLSRMAIHQMPSTRIAIGPLTVNNQRRSVRRKLTRSAAAEPLGDSTDVRCPQIALGRLRGKG
jgi:NAD(P)-dependent dehydrogenase (short-subunit alcohol dehydrogenase family)